MVETYLQIHLQRATKDMDKLTSKLKTLHESDAIEKNGLGFLISFPIAFKLWKTENFYVS